MRLGASVGLTPTDIRQMHLWEFNNYVIGYKMVIKREQENIVTLAYQTAGFMNSKNKPKPLKHYLDKIRNAFLGRPNNNTVDVEKSKEIQATIDRLMKEKEGTTNG